MKKKIGVWEKTQSYIYGNFKLGLEHIKEIKKYIWFMSFIFLFFVLLGLIFPIFFEPQILDLIEEILAKTQGLGVTGLIRFIMANNIQSAFFGLVFGVFFGIISLMVAVVNGYVLGFVANKTIAIEGGLILWRLLPHGIFELPAIIISLALGLKLGIFFFIYKGINKSKEFLNWLKSAFKTFIFVVVPLLVLAGIIEGIFIFMLENERFSYLVFPFFIIEIILVVIVFWWIKKTR